MPKYSMAKPFDLIRDFMDLQKQVKALQLSNPVSQKYLYTPAWTALTTNPSLGNGTIVGYYRRIGSLVVCTINLVVGSTSTFGTGKWFFGLPFPVTADANYAAPAIAFDSSANSTYNGTAYLVASAENLYLQVDQSAGNWDLTHPFSWANQDQANITCVYETDN